MSVQKAVRIWGRVPNSSCHNEMEWGNRGWVETMIVSSIVSSCP